MGGMSGTLDLLQRSRASALVQPFNANRAPSMSDSIPTRPSTSSSAKRCSANAYRVRSRAEAIITPRRNKQDCVRVSGAVAAPWPRTQRHVAETMTNRGFSSFTG
jgi:hypothetical protein